MKKYWTIVGALCLAVLAGCSKKTETAEPEPVSEAPTSGSLPTVNPFEPEPAPAPASVDDALFASVPMEKGTTLMKVEHSLVQESSGYWTLLKFYTVTGEDRFVHGLTDAMTEQGLDWSSGQIEKKPQSSGMTLYIAELYVRPKGRFDEIEIPIQEFQDYLDSSEDSNTLHSKLGPGIPETVLVTQNRAIYTNK